MAALIQIESELATNKMTNDLTIQDQNGSDSNVDKKNKMVVWENDGVCAICLDKIDLQETALVIGCDHAYCVNCILQWASYKENPSCPQCKHPFESLSVHRALDGSIQDYMFEESVCLLLGATWFNPLVVEYREDFYDELQDLYVYEDEEDEENEDLEEVYFSSTPSLRIGNRKWGDNGYVRSGRQEARPVYRPNIHDSSVAGSSRDTKKKEPMKSATGRRAKRSLRREAADKAAAAKHEQHLARFGRK